jgi:Spy/CpxP family protein refolding chaperone
MAAALAAQLLVLCAAIPALSGAQGVVPRSAAGPPHALAAARQSQPPGPSDDFAGLKFTADQKAKVDLIHKDAKLRRDTVIKDQKLSAEQRDAMLRGLERIERGQMYRVLTPEQQAEVRKRFLARREASQKALQQARQQTAAPR